MSDTPTEAGEAAAAPDTAAASETPTATSPAPESIPDPAPESAAAPATEPTPATDDALLRRALEGLLFVTDRPLSAAELGKLVGVREQDKIVAVVEGLRHELEERGAGYRLVAVAEGWQMATRPELAPYMRKLFADRATMRLSTAAQETLSIIAYRQPLTRAEIEQIRGVEVIAALETLLEKRLVKVVGRKETVGRPLMYGTTVEFLRHFGLRSLEDLPPLDQFAPAEAAPAAPASAAVPEPTAEAAAPSSDIPAPADVPAEESAAELAAPPETASEPAAPGEAAESGSGDPADEEEPGKAPFWP